MAYKKLKKRNYYDSVDKEILRYMRGYGKSASGNQIAKKVHLSPSSIRPRLDRLQIKGIVKPTKIGKPRVFSRSFGKKITRTIHSPSRIKWGLDIKKGRK
ncbi:hypothetical protein LCGC14_1467120 [marine sediment metagenome]|uniref:HTH asnC-type domain-containing protein n=1 Tax=marine sediment metagenome TaxID=412755 RepID=A0A0F9JE21_9ZZZZ